MKEYFPWETPRGNQIEVCEAIRDSYNKGSKFVILQAPTGTGKSVISYTVAKYLEDMGDHTYILTSQKSLQDQYVGDFNDVLTVKGASNYICDENGQTCDVGACKLKPTGPSPSGKPKKVECNCPYKIQRDAAYENPITLLNYAYFLNMTKNFLQKDRELLICDEAHNVEGELIKYSELSITMQGFKQNDLKPFIIPPENSTDENILDWIAEIVVPELKQMEFQLMIDIEMENGGSEADEKKLKRLSRALSFVKTKIFSAERIQPGTEWSINNTDGFNIHIKPLFVNDIAKKIMFDSFDKVLLMSATILDPGQFCKNLGIDPSEVTYIDLPSTFPVENRPVYDISSSIGEKVNYQTMAKVKPKMAQLVEKLMERHEGQMGIIHTQSYDLAKYIVETVGSDRLILPMGKTKEDTIKRFMRKVGGDDKILISPSLMEGIDLHGDLGEFSIVCKAPFASLGDPFVKKRKDLDPQWYTIETLRKFIQSCGRVTRSETDKTVTYVLDPSVNNMIRYNKRFIPNWFLESIKVK